MAVNEFTLKNAENGIPSQAILDAGLNVFALQALLESFTGIAGESTKPLEFSYLGVRVSLQVLPPEGTNQKTPICITGLMVRNEGERIISEVEIDGQWIEVINELCGPMEFAISHIVEPAGIIQKLQANQSQ